jgi:Listeria-Bacteroides repeat domain (List_Bact_rpt)
VYSGVTARQSHGASEPVRPRVSSKRLEWKGLLVKPFASLILGTLVLGLLVVVEPAPAAYASTTTVWEPVNTPGSGSDTMADGTTVTVSFGPGGSYNPSWANAGGGDPFFYLTDGECFTGDARGCTTADNDGRVRFTFSSPRTSVRIHYGYVDVNDPEFVMSSAGPVDIGAARVSAGSRGNVITGQTQPEAPSYSTAGLIDPSAGVASGTVELLLTTPVSWIEFQNDFTATSTGPAGLAEITYGLPNFGQNLVGVSVPVQYAQVTFDPNLGSGSMSPQSAATPTALSANSFVRSGFRLVRWTTVADGTGTPYAPGATFPFTADTTLYAQWEADPSSGGSGESSSSSPPVAPQLAATGVDRPRWLGMTAVPLTSLGIALLLLSRLPRGRFKLAARPSHD